MGDGAFVMLLVLLAGGYFVVSKVLGAGVSKLNRTVIQPKSYAAGQRLVSTEIVCTAPLGPDELVHALAQHIPAEAGQPTGFKGRLFRTALDETGVNFSFANALAETFTAEIDVQQQDEGSKAVFRFLTWNEIDGVIAGVDEMERLAADVREAMSGADAAATAEERPVQPGQEPPSGHDDTGHRAPLPEPTALAFSSFPGLEQAHAIGPLHYRVMWEAVSRPAGIRRAALGAIVDRPRVEVDAVVADLQKEGLVDISTAGLIRSLAGST